MRYAQAVSGFQLSAFARHEIVAVAKGYRGIAYSLQKGVSRQQTRRWRLAFGPVGS
jgi:hypothetical protein